MGKSQAKVSIPKKGATGGLSVVKREKKPPAASPLEDLSSLAEFLGKSDSERITSVESLIAVLSKTNDESKYVLAAKDLSIICFKYGFAGQEGQLVTTFITKALSFKVSTVGGIYMLLAIQANKMLAKAIEPFIVPIFGDILSLSTDKSATVREQSASIAINMMRTCTPFSFRLVLPQIVKGMTSDDWRVRVAALLALKELAPRVSKQITPFLPMLIPVCTECIIDSKQQVQSVAVEALTAACSVITNDDIRHLVPELVSVIAKPEDSSKVIEKLIETTFVQNVDGATLALIAPLLGKILRGRSSALKRKAARVIDSMCRLVQEPEDVRPFVPMLLPYLDRAIDEVPDEEVVEVCNAARDMLLNALGEGGISIDSSETVGLKRAASNGALDEVTQKAIAGEGPLSVIGLNPAQVTSYVILACKEVATVSSAQSSLQVDCIFSYVGSVVAQLLAYHTLPNPSISDGDEVWRGAVAMSSLAEWKDCIIAFTSSLFYTSEVINEQDSEQSKAIQNAADVFAHSLRIASLGNNEDMQKEEEEDVNNVCNLEFSLAYGSKVLLQNARLKLGKGRRYGLMGKNGVGKTTLLTNIGNGAIEAMPKHLKCVYVQHEDSRDDMGVSTIDELLLDKDLEGCNVTKEEAEAALRKINFTETMISSPRTSLSGGWKMKLIITKAILAKADILLLDEPTNHLDKASVNWLESYIIGNKDLSCLIVSHDTGFLDNTITDVIHYEGKELVYYPGNITQFVEIHPEAKYYYDLEKSSLSFKFPVPEKLDGINSSTKTVLFARGVNYTYPGAETPQLTDVNVKVVLGSRVGVLGPNGAGKSTLIKMLVKETKPDCGEVWNHMNLRIAYVAQHSFHHVEEHLDKSPVDYMKWRFGKGVDKESLMKETIALAAEEVKNKEENLKYGEVTDVVSRRKNGKHIEYEIKFHGQSHRDPNKYFNREKMLELGHEKLVEQMDIKVAAMAAGLDVRPILINEIQSHLDDFCLESEFGTHSVIRRLSGGQKVKLVLAGAMWNKPHLLVLDEPTNYLDREALGALTSAIKSFGGGVLIISHNSEFVDALCTEKWIVGDGKVLVEGEAAETTLKTFDKNNKIRKSKSNNSLPKEDTSSQGHTGAGCTNANVIIVDKLMNPKRLEPLTAKEEKKLGRLAAVAGKSMQEYIEGITSKSPEWKWL